MSYFKKALITEITISLIIIIALLWSVLFFRSKISGSTAQIIDDRIKLIERSESLKTFNLLQSQYNSKGRSYLNVLHNFIPSEDKLIHLGNELRLLAGDLDLESGWIGFDNIEPATPTDLGSASFSFRVKGNEMKNLFEFIQSLEYPLAVDSFRISRAGPQLEIFPLRGRTAFRPSQ